MLLGEEHFHRYLRLMKEQDLQLQLAAVLKKLIHKLAAILQREWNFELEPQQMNIVEKHFQLK